MAAPRPIALSLYDPSSMVISEIEALDSRCPLCANRPTPVDPPFAKKDR